MSWALQLDTASFSLTAIEDYVEFDVLSIDDAASQRRIAQHKYPYRDGADLDDMGREPRSTRLTAIFHGDDYEENLSALLEIVDKGEVGTFKHPILGQWQARASISSVQHTPDDRDAATVQIEFVEDGTDTKIPTLYSLHALEAEVESWVTQIGLENTWGYSEVTDAASAISSAVTRVQAASAKVASEINQARAKIDKAVDKLKELTDVENYKCVRALKRAAYSLQKLGIRVQEIHPPVAKQRTHVQVPLVVLAQRLYGKDARTRAGELAALNNVKNPLLVTPTEMKVYTR